MKNNKKKGFTIVELVIVIAVIGILSAILIPTFVGVTKAANEAALKSNLANAYSMYMADAADGYVDSKEALPSTEHAGFAEKTYVLEVVSNEDVALKDAEGNYYFYNNGWDVSPVKPLPTEKTANEVCTKGTQSYAVTYNGFEIYKITVTPSNP